MLHSSQCKPDTYLSQPWPSKIRYTHKWCPCKQRLRRQNQRNAFQSGKIVQGPCSASRSGWELRHLYPMVEKVESLWTRLIGLEGLSIAPEWVVSSLMLTLPALDLWTFEHSVNIWTNAFHLYIFCFNYLKEVLMLLAKNSDCYVFIVLNALIGVGIQRHEHSSKIPQPRDRNWLTQVYQCSADRVKWAHK